MPTATLPETRPDYRTIRGGIEYSVRSALAAKESVCPQCGSVVEEAQPIIHVGTSILEGKIDYSGAEWICESCFRG